MALIYIEYGSLARSDTMNKNFLYLENKISETSGSVMTSISSVLSNIATINGRLDDLSESIADYVEEFNTTLENYKEKTKLLINKTTMVPNWEGCYSISIDTEFKVPTSGYILALPTTTAKGNLLVNGNISLVIKQRSGNYDNASQLLVIQVKEGDLISSDMALTSVYFLPAAEITIEKF